MKPKVIMFDIDGVLADFTFGFTSVASSLFKTKVMFANEPKTWWFEEYMTREQIEKTLETIRHTRDFWFNLPLAPNLNHEDLGRINRLNEIHRVYFVTSRMENGLALQETYDWLNYTVGIAKPNIIMSKRKGEIARSIEANYAIDDKWDNAHFIHWFSDSPQTKSYLLDRPYNQVHEEKVGARRVKRIKFVREFLDDIERGV